MCRNFVIIVMLNCVMNKLLFFKVDLKNNRQLCLMNKLYSGRYIFENENDIFLILYIVYMQGVCILMKLVVIQCIQLMFKCR